MPIVDYASSSEKDLKKLLKVTYTDKNVVILISDLSNKISFSFDLSEKKDTDFLKRILKSLSITLDETLGAS